ASSFCAQCRSASPRSPAADAPAGKLSDIQRDARLLPAGGGNLEKQRQVVGRGLLLDAEEHERTSLRTSGGRRIGGRRLAARRNRVGELKAETAAAGLDRQILV